MLGVKIECLIVFLRSESPENVDARREVYHRVCALREYIHTAQKFLLSLARRSPGSGLVNSSALPFTVSPKIYFTPLIKLKAVLSHDNVVAYAT